MTHQEIRDTSRQMLEEGPHNLGGRIMDLLILAVAFGAYIALLQRNHRKDWEEMLTFIEGDNHGRI